MIRGDSHQLCDDLFAVYALILDVVNGIENADVLVFLMILVEHPIENGNHCGLPVVAVDDVRLPAQFRQNLQHGTGEEDEAFAVIVEAVHAVPHEVIRVVQQVIGDAAHSDGIDTAVLLAPAHLHVDVLEEGHPVADFRRDGTVQRQNHTAVHVLFLAECSGKRADHIGESAGCGKGERFAGCK